MNGALPPSSIDVRSTWFVARAINALPTEVEPVKLILRRRGSSSSVFEIAVECCDVTRLTTPAGTPA